MPQTPKPAPKYKSYSECLLKEAAARGMGGDLGNLAIAVASAVEPTGALGIITGMAGFNNIASNTAMDNGLGALSLSAGVTNFANNVKGVSVRATYVNRGVSVTLGSSFWKGVPGVNKAFAWTAVGVGALGMRVKGYDVISTCNQLMSGN